MTVAKAYFRIIGTILLSLLCISGVYSILDEDKGFQIFIAICFSLLFLMLMVLIIEFIIGYPRKLVAGYVYKVDNHFQSSKGHYIIMVDGKVYFTPLIKVVGEAKAEELLCSGGRFRVVGKDGNWIYIKEG